MHVNAMQLQFALNKNDHICGLVVEKLIPIFQGGGGGWLKIMHSTKMTT